MSGTRWIPVDGYGWNAVERYIGADVHYDDHLADISGAWQDAEGQRVEAVRWCETHDERARITPLGIETCWPGDDALEDCAVTDAVVILPPKDAA